MLRPILRASVLATFCYATPAPAELIEHLGYRNYPVAVSPGQSLRQAINAASPIHRDGQVFHGYTRWQVNWRFATQARSDGRCHLTRIQVDLNITIDQPELRKDDAARHPAFTSYLHALREHELGHARIGREAATSIERRIFILPEMADCGALEQRANELGHQTMTEFQRRDIEYDRQTGHGKTQGAWLTD